jgi:hypothetical protein
VLTLVAPSNLNSLARAPAGIPATRGPVATEPFDRYDAALLIGAALYLAANLFADPRTPFLIGGDQMFFWVDALRLLSGQHIYQDFLQFTPPGTDLVYLMLFRAFGPRIWVTNLAVALLGVLLCWLGFRLARRIMGPPQAALAAALLLILVYGKWLDATHHWFSVLAVLCATAVLMEGTTPKRIAIAGALLGLASFFTQTRGIAAALGIAAFMTWEPVRTGRPWLQQLRRALLLFGAFALAWLVLSSYYIASLGLHQLWFFQVDFVRGHMLGKQAIPLDPADTWSDLSRTASSVLAYGVLPGVYAISLWKCSRSPPAALPSNEARVGLLACVGVALFLEIAVSPNWLRAYCVAAPGVVLLVWLLRDSNQWMVRVRGVMWIGVLALAAHQTWSRHQAQPIVLELPGGRAAARALVAEKLTWLRARTQPGQLFFDAGWLGPYLPLALRNPLFLDDMGGYMFRNSEHTRPADTESGSQALLLEYVQLSSRQLLANHVQYVVWMPRLALPPFHVPVFHEFLNEHYRKVWTFSDQDEVWELKPAAGREASLR